MGTHATQIRLVTSTNLFWRNGPRPLYLAPAPLMVVFERVPRPDGALAYGQPGRTAQLLVRATPIVLVRRALRVLQEREPPKDYLLETPVREFNFEFPQVIMIYK